MSLWFILHVDAESLGHVEIRRITEPKISLPGKVDPESRDTYRIWLDSKMLGEVDHRHGDGPWHLVHLAMNIIKYQPKQPDPKNSH
jgi:hypothetical protein